MGTKPTNVQTSLYELMYVEQVDKMITIMSNPRQYKIPDWFLNRQKDIKDGKYGQVMSNILDSKIRDDLERLKKIRAHRGLRHFWGLVSNFVVSCHVLGSYNCSSNESS